MDRSAGIRDRLSLLGVRRIFSPFAGMDIATTTYGFSQLGLPICNR